MSGYIKLYRGWHDSAQFADDPYCERAAWCWLLTNAAWKETMQRNHKGEPVAVGRGQFRTSLRTLAAEWRWSVKRVRTFLKVLEKCAAIGTQKAQGGTLITICKYDEYQASGHAGGTEEGTQGAQSGHTKEEGKEDKKEENTHYAFFGRVIRLTSADFGRWKARYHGLADLEGELGSLDDWLNGQDEKTRKGWFHIVSGSLNKKHQAALKAARTDDGWGEEFTGPC